MLVTQKCRKYCRSTKKMEKWTRANPTWTTTREECTFAHETPCVQQMQWFQAIALTHGEATNAVDQIKDTITLLALDHQEVFARKNSIFEMAHNETYQCTTLFAQSDPRRDSSNSGGGCLSNDRVIDSFQYAHHVFGHHHDTEHHFNGHLIGSHHVLVGSSKKYFLAKKVRKTLKKYYFLSKN
uniref:Uncharacterized protein n=1 Tax=Romanomermis culicivorax TaxID=13658 RepID=A0A915K7X5_ROMCU